jgi:hypothetical protein
MTQVLDILGAFNPTLGEITATLSGLSKIPTPVLVPFLKGLDEDMIRKLATWSDTFVKHINDLGPDRISAGELAASMDYGTATDFFDVMSNTKFVGTKMDLETISQASNMMTKAIKGENWQQAIQVGLSLAKLMPV